MAATFMGIDFQQNWNDLDIWEEFYNKYAPRTLIELGTGRGGMAIFSALQCASRGMHYHTFDNNMWFNASGALASLLNIKGSFHLVDIFSDEGINQVVEIINQAPRPIAMFFDDGNKPREWSIFAPRLAPGDFCIVHDWGNEFTESDIGDVPVERILTTISDSRGVGWKSMWFVRK
jgi:cephalosporin hydroxylase